MPVEQIILFVAVAALGLALVVVLVVPRWRAGARASLDARKPQSPGTAVAAVPPPAPVTNMVCPTCRRQYAPGLRFCPYDARVLTLDAQPGEAARATPTLNPGKICPSCSRRYDAGAMVCGRDGSALVSVN